MFKFIIIILLSIFCFNLNASDTYETYDMGADDLFFSIGAGLATNKYSTPMQNLITEVNKDHFKSGFSLKLNGPNVFIRVNEKKTLLGFGFNWISDEVKSKENSNKDLVINQYSYTVAAIHFFSGIDSGVFLEGSLGLSQIDLNTKKRKIPSELGPACILGAGYKLDLTNLVDLMASADLGLKILDGYIYTSMSLNMSMIFSFNITGKKI